MIVGREAMGTHRQRKSITIGAPTRNPPTTRATINERDPFTPPSYAPGLFSSQVRRTFEVVQTVKYGVRVQ